MKKFEVEITETLQRTVTVEAASQEEAERMVDRGWRDGDYVLTDEDYVGVDFKTTGEHELSEKKMLDVLLVKPNEHPRTVPCGTRTGRCTMPLPGPFWWWGWARRISHP